MHNNVKILKDNSDKYFPWVELYNAGEDKVDLSGYGLSNEDYIPLKWTFPKNTVIKSKKIFNCIFIWWNIFGRRWFTY